MPRLARPLAATLLVLGVAAPAARAQEVDPHPVSFGVSLNQDNFFGFYPSFTATYGVSPTLDVAFYGILWTIPAFGLGGGGQNLWTEVGGGLRFKTLGNTLFIKPQLGITNGSLLSGGAEDGAGPLFLDGVVPSLTVNYSGARLEAEWYSGYYLAARRPSGNTTLDFLHFWLNAGVKLGSAFSVGAHYEQLRNTRNSATGQATNNYQWLGAYGQVALKNGHSFRFTAGPNILDGAEGDFYKVSVNLAF